MNISREKNNCKGSILLPCSNICCVWLHEADSILAIVKVSDMAHGHLFYTSRIWK